MMGVGSALGVMCEGSGRHQGRFGHQFGAAWLWRGERGLRAAVPPSLKRHEEESGEGVEAKERTTRR